MLPALATVEDLEKRNGKPVPSNQIDRAQAALDDASTLVRSQVGRTWVDALGDLTTVPDVAFTVVLAVALRCYVGESVVDENSLGAQLVNTSSRRPLYLTRTEKDALATLSGNRSLFSIDVTRGDDRYFDTIFVGADPDSDGLVPFISAQDDV